MYRFWGCLQPKGLSGANDPAAVGYTFPCQSQYRFADGTSFTDRPVAQPVFAQNFGQPEADASLHQLFLESCRTEVIDLPDSPFLCPVTYFGPFLRNSSQHDSFSALQMPPEKVIRTSRCYCRKDHT